MAQGTVDRGDDARLVGLIVTDPPAAWTAAGFAVAGDVVRLATTAIHLVGGDHGTDHDVGHDRSGIIAWTLSGLDATDGPGEIDGLPTTFVAESPEVGGQDRPAHANGVRRIDHVVVSTPRLDRTIAAFEAVGLACRRIREASARSMPMRQAFFRVGPTIVEVVSGGPGTGGPGPDGPARFFGLAVDVDDLDATATLLGDGIGRVKDAVQRGRRIATLRHRALGLSVAVAAMDDHGDR